MALSCISDAGNVAQGASIVAGFGATALVFRLQRHLEQLPNEPGDHSWIPVADWLLIAAMTIAVVGAVVPLLMLNLTSTSLPRASCAAACVLLVGYVFAVLAHYRLIFGAGIRYQTYPLEFKVAKAEKVVTIVSVIIALAVAMSAYAQSAC